MYVWLQLCQAGGPAVGAVESRHGEERPEGAAEGDEPEHAGQGVPSVTGNCDTSMPPTV